MHLHYSKAITFIVWSAFILIPIGCSKVAPSETDEDTLTTPPPNNGQDSETATESDSEAESDNNTIHDSDSQLTACTVLSYVQPLPDGCSTWNYVICGNGVTEILTKNATTATTLPATA